MIRYQGSDGRDFTDTTNVSRPGMGLWQRCGSDANPYRYECSGAKYHDNRGLKLHHIGLARQPRVSLRPSWKH